MASETVREGLSRYIDGRIRTHTADEIADGILAHYIVLMPEDLEAKLAAEREACARIAERIDRARRVVERRT